MEQYRQGKSAKWICNLEKRIGYESWARESQFRTRGCRQTARVAPAARVGCRMSARGRTAIDTLEGLPQASNSRLRIDTIKGNPTI
ncbi:UNVERIFIED_CONTAM: hypothetical protein Sradi_2637800 [Sesamum radiatum]|uniref:Uncharacterized protein n=1 Tax=Sesamum radiatum TaxID=300843 RepID=A0AAW2S4W1_SESRA